MLNFVSVFDCVCVRVFERLSACVHVSVCVRACARVLCCPPSADDYDYEQL